MADTAIVRRRWRTPVLIALASAPVTAVALAPPAQTIDAQALLARADAVRNPAGSFSVRIALSEYRRKALSATAVLTVYARPAPNSGQYNNVVRYLQPSQDADKLLLRNGVDLWFYDPSSKASIRISPQARLLGQASNGDVMSTNLARDYTATMAGTEAVADGGGANRQAVHLALRAQRPDVTYARADYWIDGVSAQPIKAQFRTADGRLLKTAFFRRFQPILGKTRPTQTVIIDGLNPDWVTVLDQTQFAQRDIPQTWLQRDFLPRFTAATN